MGLFDVFSKGGKYFGKAIEPKCEYCEHGKRSSDGNKVLCTKKGMVDAEFHCPKFQYSPLKRIPVKQMLFGELSATEQYDGIWACASILHLPKVELVDVLQKVADALKTCGVLYTSFKYGEFEGIRGGRYFTDLTEKSLTSLMAEVPSLQIVDTWITNDVRPGREEERWINILARRS